MEACPSIPKIALFILAFMLLFSTPGLKASDHILAGIAPPAATNPPSKLGPWHIEAHRLTFFHSSGVILGEGAVRVWRGNLKIHADRIIYDTRRDKVRASGAVVIYMDQDILRGTEGELDLNTSTGTMKNAHLFLHKKNVHLLAKQLWKTGPEEYRAKYATISTCPLPKQVWSFKCRDLRLTLGGMAIATNDTFNILDIPLAYSPWLSMPINAPRKTGFLLPSYSSSNRNGIGINLPFFWAINDSMDATFYQNPMTKRGWMEGVEFRYVFSRKNQGIFRYNFLSDTLKDHDFNNDGYIRSNKKRWWLRAKADQQLPFGFNGKLDLDIISDRDYLQEFDRGPMGYNKTNRIFQKTFGRSLVDDTALIRPSTVQITKLAQDLFIGSEVCYNDRLSGGEARYSDRILRGQDRNIQTLPRLVLHGFKKRLWNTPLYYDWNTSYVNYWRNKGLKEQRLHMEPRISLPLNLHGWADLLLSGSIEDTMYNTSGNDPKRHTKDHPNRLLYNLEADLSTTLARTYHLSNGKTIRHSIRPRITYQYRPSSQKQNDIPGIDTLDQLEPTNKITWSLLTFLSSKSLLGPNRFAYMDLIRFRMEQSYYIRQSSRIGPSASLRPIYWTSLGYDTRKDGTIYHRPLSDLYAELEVRPSPYSFLRYDTTYNFYGKGFTSHNFLVRLSSLAGDHLGIDYRYNCLTNINELNIDLRAVLSPSWYATYRLKRSLAKNTDFESTYGLRYQSACWALEGNIKKDRDETSFTFRLDLLGIGGWGKKY